MKELKNELAAAISPYLQQHASQPVAWQIWDKKRLTQAQESQKLLLISIGYSACHWCHVMAHESFEDATVAHLMNAHFINFKIDREERPDLDQVYMSALQIFTGHGGWPLNIIALPDGRPIWGTTYLPKENWCSALQQIQHLNHYQPDKLLEQANRIQEAMQAMAPVQNRLTLKKKKPLDARTIMASLYEKVDTVYGGFLGAPKFMMPVQLNLWQMAGQLYQNKEYLNHFHNTLTKMALGGLYDPIEGGFSRYAVDQRWHIPHFEKMAYDNGQLLSVYSQAYLLKPEPLYKETVLQTIDFIQNHLSDEEGGVFSALDADSQNAEGQMEEGAYYVWTPNELKNLLKEDFWLFTAYYQVNENGYWENGKYVLMRVATAKTYCQQQQLDLAEFQKKQEKWRSILQQAKKKRSFPFLDDKQICSWNAMVCFGLLMAARSFSKPDYTALAQKHLRFITDTFVRPSGQLWRIHKKGVFEGNGLLEDYAQLIKLYVTAYETFFVEAYLTQAGVLTTYVLNHFFDTETVLFLNNEQKTQLPWNRSFELEDNVIASSNALMAENLWRLAMHQNKPEWKKRALDMLSQMQESLLAYPRSYCLWWQLALWDAETSVEIAVVGPNYKKIMAQLQQHPYPLIHWAGAPQATAHPLLIHRGVKGKTLIYFCQGQHCEQPEEDWKVVWSKLDLLLN